MVMKPTYYLIHQDLSIIKNASWIEQIIRKLSIVAQINKLKIPPQAD
jgi:hypothetical protein